MSERGSNMSNIITEGTYQIVDGELVAHGAMEGFYVGKGNGRQFFPGFHCDGYDVLMLTQFNNWSLVGVWTDSETGIQYVDPVAHLLWRDNALAMASRNGELAIWDIRKQREVRL